MKKNQKLKNILSLFLIFLISMLNIFSFDGNRKTETVSTGTDYIFSDASGNGIISGRQDAIKKQGTLFSYADNNIYEIYSRPNFVTVIKLAPDEEVLDLVSGDTENWNFHLKKSTNNRTMIYVMATDSNLRTNLFIPTSKRTYHFNIDSGDIYNAIVEFQYPNERRLSLENFVRENEVLTTDIDKVNTRYSISNKTLNFSPESVYDDGEKTYIIFKSNLREIPNVLMKGEDGRNTLTLPKVANKRMVLDRVSSKIILVLGNRKVNITNLKNDR